MKTRAGPTPAADPLGILHEAVESLVDGLALYDSEERLVLCNGVFRALFAPAADLLVRGAGLEDFLRACAERGLVVGAGPGFAGGFAEASARIDGWLRDRLAELRGPNGPVDHQAPDDRWIRVKARRAGSGGLAVIVSDVTEAKRHEEVRRKSEERFRHFAEASSDWLWEQDENLRFRYLSNAVNLKSGLSAAAHIGETRQEVVTLGVTDEQWQRHQADLDARRPFRDFQFQRINPQGKIRDISVSGTPIFDAEGRFTGYRGIARDITDIKRREAELLEAKLASDAANRAKSEFLANVSHELRTPLNAILGFSEVMTNEMFGPLGGPRYREYARDIHTSGEHLLELINDILDVAKIEAGRYEPRDDEVSVSSVVESCVRLLQPRIEAGGLTLSTAIQRQELCVRADERALKQIVLNLLSNAVKFTPSGGWVKVDAAIQPDGGLSVAVADTGIGIDAADIPRVLLPFQQIDNSFSRKFEGTGLGLPLAKSLAEAHGGRLDITSAPGQGTTVTVQFPAERVVQGRA
ncbi:MAG: ATP-binding protein [Dongiaceae bacterium]